MCGKARGPGKTCARPPGRRAYAGGQACLCAGAQGICLYKAGGGTGAHHAAGRTAGCRAGRPASVRALRGYTYTGQPPGKKHRRQHRGAGRAQQHRRAKSMPIQGRRRHRCTPRGGQSDRLQGKEPPCRPRLSFRPSFLPAAKRTARGLFSRRRAAKPYCMHRAGGAYAAGPPRPVLPNFYHCHLILEYCLF